MSNYWRRRRRVRIIGKGLSNMAVLAELDMHQHYADSFANGIADNIAGGTICGA